MRRLIAIAALILLAACQPLPQPFLDAERTANPLLQLKDGGGVVVREVTGLSPALADQLRAGLAEALREKEVVAAVDVGNKTSTVLRGAGALYPVGADEFELAVTWFIQAPDSAPLQVVQRQPIPAARADNLPGPLLADISRRAAAAIIPAIQDPMPSSQVPDAVVVWAVEGAPGDGKVVLKRAIEEVLRENSIPVGQKRQDKTYVILCNVEMGKPQDGQQAIVIRWTVLQPDGNQVGEIKQENKVKAGSLDKNWGEVAYYVAQAAFDGIAALLDEAGRPRAAEPPPAPKP